MAADRGLQPQRTFLAWRRTFMSLLVCDALVWREWARSLLDHGGTGSLGLDLAALGAAGATVVLGYCVLLRSAALRATPAPPQRLVLLSTCAIVALALAVAAAIILAD